MFHDFKSDPFMFCIVIGVILFVIGQSLFFMIRAVKRAKTLGISSQKIRDTITSSAVFSIAPAVSIAVTVLVLSVALGYVLPWIRLSVIGAISYEVPAAENAIDAAGLTGGIGTDVSDPKIFTAIAWVMSLGCILPLILIPIILKKVQKKVTGAVNKNAKWADIMSAAAFIGLICAFLGRGIAGTGEVKTMDAARISVRAQTSAVETTEWTINGLFDPKEERIDFTDAQKTVITAKDDGTSTSVPERSDVKGTILFEDGAVHFISEQDADLDGKTFALTAATEKNEETPLMKYVGTYEGDGTVITVDSNGKADEKENVNVTIGDGAGVLSIAAIVSSILFMLALTLLNKKLKWKWLEAFSMPMAMILSMAVVVLISRFAPDLAAIEWRY